MSNHAPAVAQDTRRAPVAPEKRPRLPLLIGSALAAAALGLGWCSARYGGANGILFVEALPSPTCFAVLAFGAGATGMLMNHQRHRAAVFTAVGMTLVTILALMVGRIFSPPHGAGVHRAPDGRLEVRVMDQDTGKTQVQRLRLQESEGMLGHYWDFGCVPGSSAAVRSVHWQSAQTLAVDVDGQIHMVTVDRSGPRQVPPALQSC